MDRGQVAKAWVWSALEDLYFSFSIGSELHRPYKIFNEILALEKVLKALLLYHAGTAYENLCEEQSKKEIGDLAKRYGHKIKEMLKEASEYIGKSALDNLMSSDFDGFSGAEMIRALEAGYMESRYPTLKPICEQFKLKGLDIYEDPLGSSGVTKFVYVVNRLILSQLKSTLDMKSVKRRFMHAYGDMEETTRFINSAFAGSIDNYL